ncbi:hypothetical protein RIF29_05747 [Crotalaria pallida]|uniref:Sodium/hydrogen exchanger n=1 Tax=Crotalaria pallida TaxID=3830 RepID=A0AAN9PB35_CROPI
MPLLLHFESENVSHFLLLLVLSSNFSLLSDCEKLHLTTHISHKNIHSSLPIPSDSDPISCIYVGGDNIITTTKGKMNLNFNETLYSSVTKFNDTRNTVCFTAPVRTVSDGVWVGGVNGRSPMKSFLPMFELQVLVIYVFSQICYFMFKPLALPLFVSQMVAGLLLGSFPNIDLLKTHMTTLFPYGTQDVISTISSLGYVFFIFVNGVQMDFTLITRTGKMPWAIAVIGLLTPLIIGHASLFILTTEIPTGFGGGYKDIYVALVTNSITMFAVIATLLNELQIQNSELGRLALSTSLVMDILSTTTITIIVILVTSTGLYMTSINLLAIFTMAILIPLACRPTMFWIIRHTPEGRPVRSVYIHLIIILVLVLGWCSTKIGQDFTLGAFILGLSVPEGPPLGSALVKKLHFFGYWFLLPIFVTTSAMRVDLFINHQKDQEHLVTIIVCIVLFTFLVKIMACFLPSIYFNMPMKDALSLSLILSSKGVVEVGLYCILFDGGIISAKTYTILIIWIMIIGSIMQLSVKFLYDPSRKYAGYQRRNIMSLKAYSELKIVACIHKPHHISPITNMLDLCCPTSQNPITVDVLHLVELVGRALPIFIPHGLYKQNSIGFQKSYSDDVILAFDIFEHEYGDVAKVHTYTVISPSNLMYEDVCHVALDKVASITFLPFHQRWSSDGNIESDDKNLRALNNKVLEISPCSVGILVSRAFNNRIRESSSIRLAIIFIGGNDDREGLCLAKRAIKNPMTHLVVYHLVFESKYYNHDEENLDDTAALREFENGIKNVTYQEIISNDGPQTASFLRDIVDEHDYFIVGRRHEINSPQTEGLSDWSEFPELGAIGDFLASRDFKTSASVLVVQQQLSKGQTQNGGWLI